MLVAGGKIISLFLVALPLQLVLFLRHSWWVVLLLPTAALLGYYTCQCIIPSLLKSPRSQQRSSATKKKCGTPFSAVVVGVGVILTVHTVAALSTNWLLETGCLPCETRQAVPKKPVLVAHRGCDFTFPENTVAAFRESVKIPGVVAIETDIQITFDGVLFILHDPHLVRTTDGETRCPSVDPMANASWLNFSTGDCPLQELRVGDWYAEVSMHVHHSSILYELDNDVPITHGRFGHNVIVLHTGGETTHVLPVPGGCHGDGNECDI